MAKEEIKKLVENSKIVIDEDLDNFITETLESLFTINIDLPIN